jgi:ABC-type branched-subunit amino acid transport system substrate-binding protein
LGIQCPSCNSFNTVVEQVISTGADAALANPPAPGG